MRCFGRTGFRQTTMHDISAEAGISVGLIYRYFESKDQVITTIALEHLAELQRKLDEVRHVPRLFDALEKVLWCDQHEPDVGAAFVVDLFAVAAHDPHVRQLMAKVQHGVIGGITDLIAASPESARLASGITPRQAAQIVFQGLHGQMLDEILQSDERSPATIRQQRSEVLHRLLGLLFRAKDN